MSGRFHLFGLGGWQLFWRLRKCPLAGGGAMLAAASLAVHAQNLETVSAPSFSSLPQLGNSYRAGAALARELRRVAVLPITADGPQSELSQGAGSLQPMFLAELVKTTKFETVTVNADDLRRQTGRTDWSGAESLPANFFAGLRRAYGCDAVLFCQLTAFRAYPPLAVGWRIKLVDAQTLQILWAVDDLFDADQAGVLSRAHQFHGGGEWIFQDPEKNWEVDNSVRFFAQYTMAACLSTLPNRKDWSKVLGTVADEPSRRQSHKILPVKKKPYGN